MNRSFAQTLSYLLHPAVYPILGVIVILEVTPYFVPFRAMLWTMLLVFTGTYIIPVLLTLLLLRMGIISSLEMRQAEQRRYPYLLGALSYYIVSEIIAQLGLPGEIQIFLLASAAVILLHLVLLRYFKPSAHMAGIGGFLALVASLALKYHTNLLTLMALIILLSGFLASARLSLKAHTGSELVFGFFSGLLIVVFALAWY